MPKVSFNSPLPLVRLEENKLVISDNAITILQLKPGNRIQVNYIQSKYESMPVIARSEVFSDPNAGNVLTHSNTVSFKGMQQSILAQFGHLFEIKEYISGMFQMIPIE